MALVLHTSGTTSRPKLVPLRHRNLVASTDNIVSTYGLSPTDVTLCVMPLFHVHGLVASVLATLASGGTVVALHNLDHRGASGSDPKVGDGVRPGPGPRRQRAA